MTERYNHKRPCRKPHATGLVKTRFEMVQECLKLYVGLSQLAAPSGCLAFWKPVQRWPFPWFVGKAQTVVPGHGSSLVPRTALQESCLETLHGASRKTDFVWCVCGGEKDGLGRQNLPLTECWQLAPPGVSWQQVFSTLCSEVPTAGGHEEENPCAACPGASCLLPHLSTEGCGHVSFKLCVKKGSALVYCYKYGLH